MNKTAKTFFIFIILLFSLLAVGCKGDVARSEDITDISSRFVTNVSGKSYVYQLIDKETGIVYLVFEQWNGDASYGGVTPLLDGDGSPTRDRRYYKND